MDRLEHPSTVEAPTLADTIKPSQITMNTRDLATEQFTDYTFVFN